MAKKPVMKIVKLALQAGQANPAPPVGTVLGPTGINSGDFCKQFNDRTKEMMGNVIPAVITIYEDRTFTFELKSSPAASLLKKAAGIEKGAGNAKTEKVGKVTKKDLQDIAEQKMADLNANDIEGAMKIIAGTARNMGIEVID